MSEVTTVVDSHSLLGEGPVWSAEESVVYWVDILGRTVHRFDPSTEELATFDVPKTVGCVVPRRPGGLLLGLEDEAAALDPESGKLTRIAAVEADDAATRINDGACDPAGRFWVGTQPWDESRLGASALYRIDAAGVCVQVLDDVTISNGLGWSPDGKTMYYIDTATHGVDAFDYDLDSGEISNRRQVAATDEKEGWPDGLAVDSEGFIWVALWGGGALHRYSPAGERAQVVKIPSTFVTSCAFGGPDLRDLYVTTATMEAHHDDLLAHPRSGALFRCDVGVAGLPTASFAA